MIKMSSRLDHILDQIIPDLPKREISFEKLPTVIHPVEKIPEPVHFDRIPSVINIMHDDGSIFYINLDSVPVIQLRLDDTYLLMWPDTSQGALLKPFYMFNQERDPVTFQTIKCFLLAKTTGVSHF